MNLSPVLRQRFFDANGVPLAGGQLWSYQAGTTTPQVTYSNSSGTTNTNPVILDADGYADVWIDPTLAYKFVLEDSSNNVQWTVDQVSFPSPGITTWSANTSYSQGAIVQDSSGYGLLYVSLSNGNQGNALTSVSYWRLIAGNVRTLTSNTTLSVTDDLVRSNSTSGNLTMTLPPVSSTPIGKKITIKDVGTGGNSTSIIGSGSDLIDGNNTYGTSLPQYAQVTVVNNGSSWDVVAVSGTLITTAQLTNGAVTQAKLAAKTSGGTTASLGQVAVSASCGTYTLTDNATPTNVTNLSVTITTGGRPVNMVLLSDGGANGVAGVSVSNGTSATLAPAELFFNRGATAISWNNISATANAGSPQGLGVGVPPSSFFHKDIIGAGTYTYSVQVSTSALVGSSMAITVKNCILMVWED